MNDDMVQRSTSLFVQLFSFMQGYMQMSKDVQVRSEGFVDLLSIIVCLFKHKPYRRISLTTERVPVRGVRRISSMSMLGKEGMMIDITYFLFSYVMHVVRKRRIKRFFFQGCLEDYWILRVAPTALAIAMCAILCFSMFLSPHSGWHPSLLPRSFYSQ